MTTPTNTPQTAPPQTAATQTAAPQTGRQMPPLTRGATIGIFGGGQLGRMLALAAAKYGFDVHIFSPEANSPAGRVCAHETIADYTNAHAVTRFAKACDVVTYEFENIDLAAIKAATPHATIHPSPKALAIARDRAAEKAFATQCGAHVAPHAIIDTIDDLHAGIASIGTPSILKTRTQGYDGKGQVRLQSADDAPTAWNAIAHHPAILEGMVAFDRELSLVCARGADGSMAFYDLVENQHHHGILRTTTAPAPQTEALTQTAHNVATTMAEHLDYVGVLTIEFFQKGTELLVNEIAPRVHNSGHWTMEGADTCQFTQHIRAIAGWPLGSTTRRGQWRMDNLLGDEITAIEDQRANPNAFPHDYGKTTPAPGRKMGHITHRIA